MLILKWSDFEFPTLFFAGQKHCPMSEKILQKWAAVVFSKIGENIPNFNRLLDSQVFINMHKDAQVTPKFSWRLIKTVF